MKSGLKKKYSKGISWDRWVVEHLEVAEFEGCLEEGFWKLTKQRKTGAETGQEERQYRETCFSVSSTAGPKPSGTTIMQTVSRNNSLP